MKLSTLSTAFPSTTMLGSWVPAPRFWSFVFGHETRRPSAAAGSLKLSRQQAASGAELTRRVLLFAYTKLLKWSRPTTGFINMCRKIQSMAMLKRADARTQPCLMPLVVWRRSEKFWPRRTKTPKFSWRAAIRNKRKSGHALAAQCLP